jgi:5-methylcytosine-specific restriction endonuclease McrA
MGDFKCASCQHFKDKAFFMVGKRRSSYCWQCRRKINKTNNRKGAAVLAVQKRQWADENPTRAKIAHLNHRAHDRYGAMGNVTVEGWEAELAASGYSCRACGNKQELTPDHVIPLSSGGANEDYNIQVLCFRCNSSKQKKETDYRTLQP